MNTEQKLRDYSLSAGDPNSDFTLQDWYTTSIPRKRMKELMKRSDAKGLRSFGLWLGSMGVAGLIGYFSWGTWIALPAFLIYGILYGSGSPSRWHECSHGTVFRTGWLNAVAYHLVSFMALKNPVLWRWSHVRHHTQTLVVGRDPEIEYARPPDLIGAFLLNSLHLKGGFHSLWAMLRHSAGVLNTDEKDFVPEKERGKVAAVARIHFAIYIGFIVWAVTIGHWMPLVYVGLPAFYGGGLNHLMTATQHAGLAEDIPDHRLNCRTVYMNSFFRFVYSNMNYHVEHHMFPMVPSHALPDLHKEIKGDCPPHYPSLWAAYKEIIPALLKQRKDPSYFVQRTLPEGANPTPDYRRPHSAAE